MVYGVLGLFDDGKLGFEAGDEGLFFGNSLSGFFDEVGGGFFDIAGVF